MIKATRWFAYLVLLGGVIGAFLSFNVYSWAPSASTLGGGGVGFLLFGSISLSLEYKEEAEKQRKAMLEELKAIRKHLCPEAPAEQKEETK